MKTEVEMKYHEYGTVYNNLLNKLNELLAEEKAITLDELHDLLSWENYTSEIEENDEFENTYEITGIYNFYNEDLEMPEAQFNEYFNNNRGTLVIYLTLYDNSDIIKDMFIEYYGPFD